MAVSIRELLGDVRVQLEGVGSANAEHATKAVAGLAPIGRALDWLYGCRPLMPWADEAQPPQAAALAVACLETARCWSDGGGRVADLLGVTADAIGRSAPSFTHEQRWALTEALAETARRCVDVAQRFEPFAAIPQLVAVRGSAVACERRATEFPESATDRIALDHLVPARHITTSASERIVDAAAALHLEITRRRYHPRLRMAEVVITLNAAQLAATHAAAALREADHPAEGDSKDVPGLAAPDAWRAARANCASFDDGTKLRPPDDSSVAAAAARLGRALLDHLGSTATARNRAALTEPRTLQALGTVAGLLPEIASGLDRATAPWAANGQLWAPERRLLSYEDRNDAATSARRAAVVGYVDLGPLSDALRNAAYLTSALASELAQHSHSQQPHRSEAHTAATAADRSLPIRAQSAHDAVRHARAVHPTEWALPTRPRVPQLPGPADDRDDSMHRARAAVDRFAARSDRLARQRDEAVPVQRLTTSRLDDHGAGDGWEVGR